MNKEEYLYVLNDESVTNSHGFNLLNSAAKLERYNANPVMLFNHDSGSIIGQIKDLKVDGTKLIGKAEFDEEDPLALKCKRQSKCGILKGCSPGIIINAVEIRTDALGKDTLTVTDWELCETSLVAIPSNKNALKLYMKSGEAIPDDKVDMSIQSLITNKIKEKMNQIILTAEAYSALSLQSDTADSKSISAAIMELKARAENAEKTVNEQIKLKAESLVTAAIASGKITADKKEQFVKLAIQDYEMAKTTLEVIPDKVDLKSKIKNTSKGGAASERDGWTYLKWAKEDPEGLKKMKAVDIDAFAELKKHIS